MRACVLSWKQGLPSNDSNNEQMGLDIRYASKINFESRKDPVEAEEETTCVFLYPNNCFIDQSEGIQAGYYTTEGVQGYFHAGPYSVYSIWRQHLADMIGFKIEVIWQEVMTPAQKIEIQRIPFVELLCFSDCEGLIGPETSIKLYADFLAWDERAKSLKSMDSFYEQYQEWSNAFKVASDNGCVMLC